MAHPNQPNDGQPQAPHPADERSNVPARVPSFAPTAPSKTNESASAMLAARARAEIEARTLVAINRPRNIEQFREAMLAACDRVRFADSAMYEKPVGSGKSATGLSIRFAEEAARQFKNLDTSVSVVSEDDEQRVLEAVGVDLEANVAHRVQAVVPKYVERLSPRKGDEVIGSRQNSRGQFTFKIRANDDALFTEHQKAAAKAKREVILMHIPSDIKEECEERIERTLAIVGDDPAAFLAKVVRAFDKEAITEAQIADYLGKPLSSLNVAEIKKLGRVLNGITQGETTWAQVVAEKAGAAAAEASAAPASEAPAAGGAGASSLRDSLGKRAAGPSVT